ncbi:uncharacterized protein LOC18434868 [Amborella trichopoda]|uniref:Uncharacterized protein n=1 Tax=Amborella trichopoda TaxID=13333 RepID=W1PFF3_AMBTC|nr:uncharacterized protein LOC18434868 [Amborella trichopoda]ERN06668.1 hypothetical protein AMTR_s00058p00195860 [Amborella trichopoda]|eukprot:XP_006844993.1 uncharacterized protein LOC18434868 [Amborella trichopoda]
MQSPVLSHSPSFGRCQSARFSTSPTIFREAEEEAACARLSDDEDFEFAAPNFEFAALDFEPKSADELFFNGQIKPFFGREISPAIFPATESLDSGETQKPARFPLRDLFSEETRASSVSQEDRPSSANGIISPESDVPVQVSNSKVSETSDLEGLSPETYCVWAPHKTGKSSSAGSSRRWRLRDLLHRSGSEGSIPGKVKPFASDVKAVSSGGKAICGDKCERKAKVKPVSSETNGASGETGAGKAKVKPVSWETKVVFGMVKKGDSKAVLGEPKEVSGEGKVGLNGAKAVSGEPKEVFGDGKVVSVERKAVSGGVKAVSGFAVYENSGFAKRKSYLPYKQELVGCMAFPNINGLSRTLHPFASS